MPFQEQNHNFIHLFKWEIIIEVEMPEIVLKAGTRMNKLACPWEAFLIGIYSL